VGTAGQASPHRRDSTSWFRQNKVLLELNLPFSISLTSAPRLGPCFFDVRPGRAASIGPRRPQVFLFSCRDRGSASESVLPSRSWPPPDSPSSTVAAAPDLSRGLASRRAMRNRRGRLGAGHAQLDVTQAASRGESPLRRTLGLGLNELLRPNKAQAR
jgi:hypothetical protein